MAKNEGLPDNLNKKVEYDEDEIADHKARVEEAKAEFKEWLNEFAPMVLAAKKEQSAATAEVEDEENRYVKETIEAMAKNPEKLKAEIIEWIKEASESMRRTKVREDVQKERNLGGHDNGYFEMSARLTSERWPITLEIKTEEGDHESSYQSTLYIDGKKNSPGAKFEFLLGDFEELFEKRS